MSKKANPTLIGSFVVGAVVLMVLGIIVFSKGKFLVKKEPFVLYFEGPLAGLSVGAPVTFRGVKVGSVTQILVRVNTEDRIIQTPVFIETESDRFTPIGRRLREKEREKFVQDLIQRGMRAQLVVQSFVTGQVEVALDFHPETPIKLVGADPGQFELPTVPSKITELAKKFEKLPLGDLVDATLDLIQSLDEKVNSPDIMKPFRSLDTTLKELQQLVQNIDSQVEPMAINVEDTALAAQATLKEAKDTLASAKTDINRTLKDIHKLVENVDGHVKPVATSFVGAADAARDTLQQGKKTLSTIDESLEEGSPLHYELFQTLEELSAAARSIRSLADYLERNPNALLTGKN